MCATLIDEWIRAGVRHAVVAPGSRSTPIVLALADRAATGDITVHVTPDERVAGFMGLGLGLRGVPALVVCTSGTAAVHLAPAVVEAGLSDVPMIVLTADRPPELRDVGAAQTIDQSHLFGRAVTWYHDPGVADMEACGSWRSMARRALRASARGPVHLNLPFREPLVATPAELPAALPRTAVVTRAARVRAAAWPMESEVSDPVPAAAHSARGVILAGGRSGVDLGALRELAARTGWPLIADPTSEARQIPGAVCAADQILRVREFGAADEVEVIVRVGRPAASKVVAQWVASHRAVLLQVGGPGEIDPDHRVTARVDMADLLSTDWKFTPDPQWWAPWATAEAIAQTWIDEVLGGFEELTEPAVARLIGAALGVTVEEMVVASSMPVRDLEWFGGPGARAHANRGANGIDGTISTAIGVALDGGPTAVLLGDLAFVHDLNALVGLIDRDVDVRIVVTDNDGGGIFSFLPQAAALEPEVFETYFGTPHGVDIVAAAQALGVPARTVTTAEELLDALGTPGPKVLRVPSDRHRNMQVHAALTEAIGAAVRAAFS